MNVTGIPYVDRTWNPITGCTNRETGHCKAHCYAAAIAHRFKRSFAPELHPERLPELERLRGLHTVFAGSACDLWSDGVEEAWVDQVFDRIARHPVPARHAVLVLTKRPERMREWFTHYRVRLMDYGCDPDRLLAHVWWGVTVCDQADAGSRITTLMGMFVAHRWVSYEPALGPWVPSGLQLAALDWVVAGAESGLGSRPADPEWFRAVRDACKAAGVPFYFKGWGWQVPVGQASGELAGQALTCAAGPIRDGYIRATEERLLDRHEHLELPERLRTGKTNIEGGAR